ncbi:unnamed protein product [Albugo candida]|uniref:Uncharacterized protein n=1 Tax=Albugo candida TaxID=65357 RepID=A0A024G547_9STRA|nr:unnamed protein product [Albugo candida]|eukprot:CCI41802.1 unnamed protein product [Albugo candida]
MAEKPSHCEFRMRPFDQVLLHNVKLLSHYNAFACCSITQQSKASNDSDQSLGMSSNDSSFVTGNNSIDANGAEECDQYSAPMKHSRHALEDTNTGEICRDGINIGDQTMRATVNSHRVSRHSNDNFAQSDSGGALEDDSACDFPLVLALAATANEMARNTDQMDVRNKSTHCAHHILGIVPRLVIRSMLSSCKCIDLENRLRERDNAVARLELLLRVESMENGVCRISPETFFYSVFPADLHTQKERESALQQKSNTMHHFVQSLQHSLSTQRSFFQKVSEELDISIDDNQDLMVDDASYYMKTLEAKVLELKAVSDAEKRSFAEIRFFALKWKHNRMIFYSQAGTAETHLKSHFRRLILATSRFFFRHRDRQVIRNDVSTSHFIWDVHIDFYRRNQSHRSALLAAGIHPVPMCSENE